MPTIGKALLGALFLHLSVGSHAASPDAGARWLEYGRLQLRARRYDAAVQALTTAAKISPSDALIFKELGNAYYYKGDLAQARQAYQESSKLNPADAALASFIAKLKASPVPQARGKVQSPSVAKNEKGNWVLPALMSAVIPGAGQLYDRRPARAAALGLPTLALLGGIGASYAIGNSAKDRYSNASTSAEMDEASAAWESAAAANHICIVLGVGMYVWTVIDAAVMVPPRSRAGIAQAGMTLAVGPSAFQAKFKLLEF